MSGIGKPSGHKNGAELSTRDVIEFMKKNPPRKALTSYEIDQMLIENAKNLLAYQAEISVKETREPLHTRYFKQSSLLVTSQQNREEPRANRQESRTQRRL